MTVDEALAYSSCIIGAPSGTTEEATVALAAEVRRLRDESKSYRETNESVAVCADHTEDILYSDDCPCVICELQTAHADLAALRQRHAEAVKEAFREAYRAGWEQEGGELLVDAAWLVSEARKGVARDNEAR